MTPALDGGFVAFGAAIFGLLTGPVEALLEGLAHVIGVVVDPEAALNQRLDSRCRPQLVGPAVGCGPGLEQQLQLKFLGFAQPFVRLWMGHGGQPVGLLG